MAELTKALEIRVSPGDAGDLDIVAALHGNSLHEDVLPAFGREFLCRYYRRILDVGQGVLLLATDDRIPHGFLLLTFENVSPVTVLRAADIWIFLWRSFKRPALIFSMCAQQLKASGTHRSQDTAEITLVAVAQSYQGVGVGRALVKEAHEVCAQRGITQITTKSANAAWIDFYQRNYAAIVDDSFKVLGKQYRIVRMPVESAGDPAANGEN